MRDHQSEPTVREAVGIFFEVNPLRAAIEELITAEFDESELGLLAGERTVQETLGNLYERSNEFINSPTAPCTAFVANDAVEDTVHALLGSLFFYGVTTAAGAAVASAAVLGGAVFAAVGGVAAVGAAGAAMGLVIHKNDASYLEEQVDEGHLLLFVRTHDSERENTAKEILSRHGAYDAKVYTVAACSKPTESAVSD
jgi:hypothetical protein